MKVAIGSDHRGFDVKQRIIDILKSADITYQDFGAFSKDSVDYPDIALKVGRAVAGGEFDRGILICDTGIGMSIAANKIKGIRAAMCYDGFCAYRARLHNDANIIALGTGCSEDDLKDIISKFINTDFEGGRHQRRLDKIAAIES
jgi:ribose 5-phosphate isomerase B